MYNGTYIKDPGVFDLFTIPFLQGFYGGYAPLDNLIYRNINGLLVKTTENSNTLSR